MIHNPKSGSGSNFPLQLLQHPPELYLPQGQVLRRGPPKGRRAGNAADVFRLVGGIGRKLPEQPAVLLRGGDDLVKAVDPFKALLQGQHPAALPGAYPVAPQHQVDDAAKNRHQQNGDDPGDLIGGITAVVVDVQHRRHADGDADAVKVDEVFLKPQQHHQQDHQLGQNRRPHQHHPVEQQPEQLFCDGFFLVWFH